MSCRTGDERGLLPLPVLHGERGGVRGRLSRVLQPSPQERAHRVAAASGESVERWRDPLARVRRARRRLPRRHDAAHGRGRRAARLLQPANPGRLRSGRAAARLYASSSRFRRCSCATRTSSSTSIDDLAPRSVPALKRIAAALAVVVLAVMAWQGFIAARDTIAFNDVTADLGLPRGLALDRAARRRDRRGHRGARHGIARGTSRR